MASWAKLTTEYKTADEEQQNRYREELEFFRDQRSNRVIKVVIVPAAVTILTTFLIIGILIVNWFRVQAKQRAEERERQIRAKVEQQAALAEARKEKERREEQKAIKRLYDAYHELEKQETRDKVKQEKVEKLKKRREKLTQEQISGFKNEITLAEQRIQNMIIDKEAADLQMNEAIANIRKFEEDKDVRERDRADIYHRLQEADRIRMLVQDKIDNLIKKQELTEKKLRESEEGREDAEQEEGGAVKDREFVRENKLLAPVVEIQAAAEEMNDVLENKTEEEDQTAAAGNVLQAARSAVDQALDEQARLELEYQALTKEIDAVYQNAVKAASEKREIDGRLVELIRGKREMDKRVDTQLRERNQVAEADEFRANARSFAEDVITKLSRLYEAEGAVWMEQARQMQSGHHHFAAKLMAARAIGFSGYGRQIDNLMERFLAAFPGYISPADAEHGAATELIEMIPSIFLIWQGPAFDHDQTVTNLRFRSDGTSLIYAAGESIEAWTFADGFVKRNVGLHPGLKSLAVSPRGGLVMSGDDASNVMVWKWGVTEEPPRLAAHDGAVTAMTVNTDGSILATGGAGGDIKLWDIGDALTGIMTMTGHAGAVRTIRFSADGGLIASSSDDGTIRIWNVKDGAERFVLKGHDGGVSDMAFDLAGQYLATCGSDSTVRLWGVANFSQRRLITLHGSPAHALRFSPNGDYLATADNNQVIIWESRDATLVTKIQGHLSPVTSLDFAPDGSILATAANDGIKLWALDAMATSGEEVEPRSSFLRQDYDRLLSGHTSTVIALDFSPDNKHLASSGRDKLVKIWEIRTGAESATLAGHAGPVVGVCFSRDGSKVVSAGLDSSVRIWDVSSGVQDQSLNLHSGSVYAVQPSPGGNMMATAGKDNTIKIWELSSGAVKSILTGHADSVVSVSYSSDGKRLVSGDKEGIIKMWDVENARETHDIPAHNDTIYSVSFSPNGKYVVSGSRDRQVKIWDASTGVVRATLTGHHSVVLSVSFNPLTGDLATASSDKLVKIWDPETARELATLMMDYAKLMTVSFSRDGKWLAVGGTNDAVSLWQCERIMAQMNYLGYANVIDIHGYQAVWRRLAEPSPFLNVKSESLFGLLLSGISETDLQLRLLKHYLEHQNLASALAVYRQMSAESKDDVKEMFLGSLEEANTRAAFRGNSDLSEWYLRLYRQVGAVSDDAPNLYYLRAKNLFIRSRRDPASLKSLELWEKALEYLTKAMELGLVKPVVKLVEDFNAEFIGQIPDLEIELTSVTTVQWLDRAQSIASTNSAKSVEFFRLALGKDAEAVQSFGGELTDSWALYSLACAYGLGGASAASDDEGPSTADLENSLTLLKKARDIGWIDLSRLQRDPNLEAVRQTEGFVEFLAGIVEDQTPAVKDEIQSGPGATEKQTGSAGPETTDDRDPLRNDDDEINGKLEADPTVTPIHESGTDE